MSKRSSIPIAAVAIGAAAIWIGALAVLAVMQSSGNLSLGATRLFTGVLIVAGVAVPFIVVGGFLRRRSRLDPDLPVNGRCPRCRYDLAVLVAEPRAHIAGRDGPSVQCPECGTLVRVLGGRESGDRPPGPSAPVQSKA